MDPEADGWLVRQAQRGHAEAYEVLLQRHRDRVYRIALRILGDPHHAEDVAQDVLIQIWAGLSGFAGNAKFTTWLYRIVVNRCLSHVQRTRVTTTLQEHQLPEEMSSEDQALTRQHLQAAYQAIKVLPEDLRVVFVLCQLEGLSYADVAEILAVPSSTVRGRLVRARRELTDQLREWT